ncbi:hypothetical protein [Emcibacter sp. SYSU 3D8]|uniref:hypothetical protein n=1 Tax=Emcibacter sp. SYSU 3D8 TaxID=3133969 RepID=UPI0031FF178F
MRTRLCIALAGAVLFAVPALAAPVDFAARSEPDAVEASRTAWADSIDEAQQEAGSSTAIAAFKVDLNGDGTPEIFGQVKNTYICGNAGPCVFVMTKPTGAYDVLFSVPGVENAEILDSRTGGWLDLMINDDKKYRYTGGTYRNQ